jgi:serine/threonine-protein kinase
MTEHAVPWDRVEAALDQALDLEAAARAAFVEDLARDDPELAGELRSMLEVAEDTGGLLDTDVVALLGADFLSTVSGDSRPGDAVGRNIGPYRIEAEIGHGGMGRVFLARRDDGEFDQEVALKLLRWEVPGEALVQRFRSERQVLAGLHHPGIARLLDGGVTPEGLPYLVMERIEGLPIDDHCRTMTLGLRDRVSLVRDVCGAVQFAHSRLIVHRDVKPSNILVTHGGRTKLLDFGLAKLLDDSDGSVTQAGGGAPLTPNYAAPEQIEGGAIGAAADVYALGVLLFELLTGQRPHEQGSPTTAELARRVVAEDPPLASSVVAPDERSWASRDLAGDLDAILAKALRREPDRRYSSAEQLAEDLDRYLSFQPIRARRVTPGYRLARFVRRNRGPVAAAVTFVVALSAALGKLTGRPRCPAWWEGCWSLPTRSRPPVEAALESGSS